MGRILAIDYGKKRTGLAVTDILRITANPLITIETKQLMTWLKDYFAKENVDEVVVGYPKQMNGEDSESMQYIRVFLAQFDAITKLASEGDCVIVGRCADYVLKDLPNVTRIFLYASVEKRIERIMRVENATRDEARELIRKTDKQRKSYYNFFADGNWGLRSNYDLMLRTDNRTPESVAETIISFARDFIP